MFTNVTSYDHLPNGSTRVTSEVQGWWFEQVFRGSTANRAECLWRAKHIHLDEGGVSTSVRTCWLFFFARIFSKTKTPWVKHLVWCQRAGRFGRFFFVFPLRVLFIQLGWKMVAVWTCLNHRWFEMPGIHWTPLLARVWDIVSMRCLHFLEAIAFCGIFVSMPKCKSCRPVLLK